MRYFVDCISICIWNLLVFFKVRVRSCIIRKNNREVICPSQYILGGIIPTFIPGHINCDHMTKRGVSQGSPIVLSFVMTKYFEGDTLRLCKKPCFCLKFYPQISHPVLWFQWWFSIPFIPSTFNQWNTLAYKEKLLYIPHLFLPSVLF